MRVIHREHFTLKCAEELAAQGEYFADVISKHAMQGSGLVDGSTFEIGWCVLKVSLVDKQLELQEPDYTTNPFINYKSDISASLRVLLAQNELIQRTNAIPCSARFDERIVIRKGCLSEARLYMERSNPTGNDSGWYISKAGEQSTPAPSDLESIYSFELLSLRPALLSCLLMPPGWLVVWQGNKIEAIVNADDQVILSEVQ